MVQAEEEAEVVGGHLQQGHGAHGTATEHGTRFGVDAEQLTAPQHLDSACGLVGARHRHDFTPESVAGEVGDEAFFGFDEELSHEGVYGSHRAKVWMASR